MLSNRAWLKLIGGLHAATTNNKLRWDLRSEGSAVSVAGAIANVRNFMGQNRSYTAMAGTAMYEVSASDGLGGAPYELSVWEFRGATTHPIGTVRSSTQVDFPQQLAINEALQALYKVVDSTTESSDEIVDRLLGDLGVD